MLGDSWVGLAGAGAVTPSHPFPPVVAVGCTAQRVGIMFLTEVALGKLYRITCDDPTLRQPPAGYDSVLACGRTEPGENGARGAVGGMGRVGWGSGLTRCGVFSPRPRAG